MISLRPPPRSHAQPVLSGFVIAFADLQLVFGPLPDRLGRGALLPVGLALAVVPTHAADAAAPSMGQ